MNPPKYVFIVPYRNRNQQKFFFSKYMSFLLEGKEDYEIYFSHQCDARSFNRGATKNIGFLAIKNKYPEHYKDIHFIFNDVDTIPFNKIFNYETRKGVVQHYYGYKYALGGIVVIQGSDFEKINGYPCFWGWGMEDYCLQKRCEKHGLTIDRSNFYPIGSPEILQLFDGISRIICKKDHSRVQRDNGMDGVKTIHRLDFTIDNHSNNPKDNEYTVDNSRIFFINIQNFLSQLHFENDDYHHYDLREPRQKILQQDDNRLQDFTITTENWSNIPYYPTLKERRESAAALLMSQGKQIPLALLKQIEEDKRKERELDQPNIKRTFVNANTNINANANVAFTNGIKSAHLFSKEYARFQPKSSAKPSARIGLGGVF
jgi:hypothetical protein